MTIFRRPKAATPKVEVPKVELPKMNLPKIRIPKVERPKIGIPDIEMPEMKLGKLDTDAIGRMISERLPRRPARSRLRYAIVALFGLIAVAWLALARAAAPLRASIMGLAQETRTRLPGVVKDAKRWTGQLVYRTGDEIEHSGDAMERAGEAVYQAGDAIEHAGDETEHAGKQIGRSDKL